MNLKLSNVIFSYASANNAVDDVTFSAEQGEIVGILDLVMLVVNIRL